MKNYVKIVIEKLPEIKSKMIEFAKNHVDEIGQGLELLPGVPSLLEALQLQKDVVVGLVTGNLEEIAWMKMDGLGIRKYFTVPNFGGFGSDHDDRGHLVQIAAERADKLFSGGFRLHVHVGDTPNDIQAAEFGGALPIGVCTGVFKKEDLEKASSGNAHLLDNLTDSKNFMSLLRIEC
eukprot:Gb_22352 [translate_table: standard]